MSSISSGTTSGSALVHTADTTGDLVIKSGASTTTAMTVSGTNQSVTLAGALTVAGVVTVGSAAQAVPSGSAPLFMARAWVNFNGTGTPAIRASGNVSSITDNGTGLYTVNFTTALPDGNFSGFCLAGDGSTNGYFGFGYNGTPTTTAFNILTTSFAGANTDFPYVAVAIFR